MSRGPYQNQMGRPRDAERIRPDVDLVTEEGLPQWQHSLLLALGAETAELSEFDDVVTLTIKIPTPGLELLNAARKKQTPPAPMRRYLLRCLALGLVEDLDLDYLQSRTDLLIGEL